jgi:hypothetical protein
MLISIQNRQPLPEHPFPPPNTMIPGLVAAAPWLPAVSLLLVALVSLQPPGSFRGAYSRR